MSRPNSESRQVHWVEPDYLTDRTVHPSVRLHIEHGLQPRSEFYLSRCPPR